MTSPESVLSRYLRQRQEFGELELILDEEFGPGLRQLLSAEVDPGRRSESNTASVPAAKAPPPAEARAKTRSSVAAPPIPLVTLSAGHPLQVLADAAAICTACALAKGRTNVVFGEGNSAAELVVVGEAPGADEDRTGRPFVGKAGMLLNLLLQSVGFPRESVYICNVLKCRPPGNRDPLGPEVEACAGFLEGQLAAIRPRAILAVGTFPAQSLLKTELPIGRLRGSVHEYKGIPLVPTYHPAALLRNPGWIRPVWEDLQRLRQLLAS